MKKDDASYLLTIIRQEGFDYAFESYSNFEDINDEKFHELRLKYLKSMDELKNYIKSCKE